MATSTPRALEKKGASFLKLMPFILFSKTTRFLFLSWYLQLSVFELRLAWDDCNKKILETSQNLPCFTAFPLSFALTVGFLKGYVEVSAPKLPRLPPRDRGFENVPKHVMPFARCLRGAEILRQKIHTETLEGLEVKYWLNGFFRKDHCFSKGLVHQQFQGLFLNGLHQPLG